jgi:hypothetical protein
MGVRASAVAEAITRATGAAVLATATALAGSAVPGGRASAQPDVPAALDAPWTDVAPRVDGERVLSAAVGLPDERLGRLAARRAAARSAGEERARRAIHAWADDALARVAASPAIAAAVHRAIDAHVEVARVRPLSDGSAVVEVAIAVSELRRACGDRGGLPWSR